MGKLCCSLKPVKPDNYLGLDWLASFGENVHCAKCAGLAHLDSFTEKATIDLIAHGLRFLSLDKVANRRDSRAQSRWRLFVVWVVSLAD